MLSNRIRERRMAMGVSQVELARRLGISKQSLSNWENDNIQPSIEMLMRLSECLSVSTDYLLGLDRRQYLEVSGLSAEELSHIQQLINDLRRRGPSEVEEDT